MWQSLSLSPSADAVDLVHGVTDSLNLVKTGLEAARTTIQAAQSLAQVSANPAVRAASLAINSAIDAIQSGLNSFLDDTGAYILLVPLPKKGLLAVAAEPTTQDEPGSNYVGFPSAGLLASLNGESAAALRSSPSFASIFETPTYSLGGNRYLVQTIASSVYDAGDLNRPKFSGESYWAYTLCVAGATDLAGILSTVVSLGKIFSAPNSANTLPLARSITDFVPSGVRTGPSGRGKYAVIAWDHVPPSSVLTDYDGATMRARQYAIIRSKDLRAKTATTVLDFFSSPDLTSGMTGLYGAKVLTVRDYDGVVSRYVDLDDLDPDTTYYYHIAVNTRLIPSGAGADSGNNAPRTTAPEETSNEATPDHVDFPFHLLSSAAEWRTPAGSSQLSNATLGEAPDWYRTPSVATSLPGMENLVDIIQEVLETQRQLANGTSDRVQQLLNAIAEQIAKISSTIDTLTGAVNKINAVLGSLGQGVYCTTRDGQGPVSSFVADVVAAIDDGQDPNRPPFDVGDEYVVAVLVLAVSPDAGAISTIKALMETLFGGGEQNAALEGINSVATTLARAEADLVDQITGGGDTSDASQTFDDAMVPRPIGEPDASCPR